MYGQLKCHRSYRPTLSPLTREQGQRNHPFTTGLFLASILQLNKEVIHFKPEVDEIGHVVYLDV